MRMYFIDLGMKQAGSGSQRISYNIARSIQMELFVNVGDVLDVSSFYVPSFSIIYLIIQKVQIRIPQIRILRVQPRI